MPIVSVVGGWDPAGDFQNSDNSSEAHLFAAGARWASRGSGPSGNGGSSLGTAGTTINTGRAVVTVAVTEPNRREYPALGVAPNSVDTEADADLYARRHDPVGRGWDEDERGGGGGERDGREQPHAHQSNNRDTNRHERHGHHQALDRLNRDQPPGWRGEAQKNGTWDRGRNHLNRGRGRCALRDEKEEEDPFAKAEAEEREFFAMRAARSNAQTREVSAISNQLSNETESNGCLPAFFQGGSRTREETVSARPRSAAENGAVARADSRFAGPGGFANDRNGTTRPSNAYQPPLSRTGFGANHIPMPPPKGGGGAGFGFDARQGGQYRPDHGGNLRVARGIPGASLGRGAPPLPPGAPPGARRQPPPPLPVEDIRDEERDAFQLELQRVVAEQEAERRRREGGAAAGTVSRTNAHAGASGQPHKLARELAGSALVSHPAPPPGLQPVGAPAPSFHGAQAPTGLADDDGDGESDGETDKHRSERKKRGGRRVREAETRRAAKAETVGSLGGPVGSGVAGGVGGTSVGGNLGGATYGPAVGAAAGGWGAGALAGLAWAGPVAEMQRSASVDKLANPLTFLDPRRMATHVGAGPLVTAAASAAHAAHHHQHAASANAFAYESALAALSALGVAEDASVAARASSAANGGDTHATPGQPPAALAGHRTAAYAPPPSVGLGFGNGLWSAAAGAPPLPHGPRPP